jgi:hypothetical protein
LTLTIELTPEQEAVLQAQAQVAGVDVAEYARRLLALDLAIETGAMTPAQAVEYWEREGLIGSYGDPNIDAPELARRLRARVWAGSASEEDLRKPDAA